MGPVLVPPSGSLILDPSKRASAEHHVHNEAKVKHHVDCMPLSYRISAHHIESYHTQRKDYMEEDQAAAPLGDWLYPTIKHFWCHVHDNDHLAK